jgi:sulfur-carrier protein
MRVKVPSPLHSYTNGRSDLEAAGATIAQVLDDLERRFTGIRFRIVDEQDRIRPHIRFFVNGEQVRTIDHALKPTDQVQIVAALSGG